MAHRRTVSSTKDILGNTIKVGDIVAASITYNANSSSLYLAEIDKIYLDDYSGNPYFEGLTYFRDRATGLFYESPTDQTLPGLAKGTTPVDPWNPDLSQYVPIKPKKNGIGYGYTGTNEIVAEQSQRIYAQPLYGNGAPSGKKTHYELRRVVLAYFDGKPVTKEELASRY